MQPLELRDEFLAKHMRGTAIELRNKQNTGWAQKGPDDLLAITYPTSDVQRSLDAVSAATPGKPIVFLGQRGRGNRLLYGDKNVADFHIDDDECGVVTLIDSFATTADQEQIRDRAQWNLKAIAPRLMEMEGLTCRD